MLREIGMGYGSGQPDRLRRGCALLGSLHVSTYQFTQHVGCGSALVQRPRLKMLPLLVGKNEVATGRRFGLGLLAHRMLLMPSTWLASLAVIQVVKYALLCAFVAESAHNAI